MISSDTRQVSADVQLAPPEDLIQETGCRLCPYIPTKKSRSDWKHTFHACWDPNDSNLLYVFSQNGMLKILDTKKGTEKVFHLLFRRFSSSDSSSEEKPIRKHWDKVSLTPGKPGEIMFLMGVSNTLYMTAVPGSSSPLAELTDDSSGNFAYGSPVLHIYSHVSRITSLCMSPFGQVFASGDENGLVNMINCVPPASLAEKEPEEWWQCPSATPNHQNPILRAHNGPIFSLQWLPLFHKSPDSNRVTYHYLATGSEDRMVRLWKVTLGHHRAVSFEPLMVLDTQSTHVLCLKAIRQPKPTKTVQRALSQWSQSRGTRTFGSFAGGGSVISTFDMAQPDADGAGGLDTIYLCGGTEHGSVYMWRFDAEDCGKHLEVTNVGIDDGTRLLAILHSSNRPIMNIAMMFKREPPPNPSDEESSQAGPSFGKSRPTFGRRASAGSIVSVRSTTSRWRATYGSDPPPHKLVLCVSDTVGVVRSYVLHKQAEERDNMSTYSGAMRPEKKQGAVLRTLSSLQSFDPDWRAIAGGSDMGSVSVFGRRRAGTTIEEEQTLIEGLMLTGESQFNSPVVACLFQEQRLVVTKVDKEQMDEATRESNRQVHFSSIATSMADLNPPSDYATTKIEEENEDDATKTDGSNSLVVVQAADEIRFYPVLSLMSARKPGISSELGAILAAIDEQSSVDDNSIKGEEVLFQPKLQDKIFDSEPLRSSTAVNSKKQYDSLPTNRNIENVHVVSDVADFTEPKPNRLPPPPPSPLPFRDAHIPSSSNGSNGHAGGLEQEHTPVVDTKSNHGMQVSSQTTTRKGREIPEAVIASNKTATTTTTIKRMDMSSLHNMTSERSTTARTDSVQPNEANREQSSVHTQKKEIPSVANKKIVANTNERMAEKSHTLRPSTGSVTEVRRGLSMPSVPLSDLATPALNASQSLLSKYKVALDNDTFTVASINTTISDRNEASRRVTSVPTDVNIYDDLLSVGSAAIRKRMPKASTLKKQLDPEWLRSRRDDGPTKDHLGVLLPSEPQAEIGVRIRGPPKKSNPSTQTTSSCFGIRAGVDESSLQLHYTLDIDPNDLFGELSTGLGVVGKATEKAGDGVEASWRKLEAIDYMLGRSILLNSTV